MDGAVALQTAQGPQSYQGAKQVFRGVMVMAAKACQPGRSSEYHTTADHLFDAGPYRPPLRLD